MSATKTATRSPDDSCVVVTAGQTVGGQLCEGLRSRGCRVVWLYDASGAVDTAAAQTARAVSLRAKADLLAELEQAAGGAGLPKLVVLSVVPTALQTCVDTDTISEEQWREGVDSTARAFLYALQGAHALLSKSGGGTIVCLGPAFGLVGAARLLALSTLLEAQRALVKSAARQWGSKGIRVHWISLGEAGNFALLESAPLPRTPELGPPPPALGSVPAARELAGLIHWLASDDAKVLTGATMVADGGEWMVP